MNPYICNMKAKDKERRISSEQFIGVLCKEVGAKHGSNFIGPTMAYDMTEEEAKDAAYKLTDFLFLREVFQIL